MWIMGGTGKVLNTIGFCEIFEFLGAVLWSVVGNQLGWDAMFCKDALKIESLYACEDMLVSFVITGNLLYWSDNSGYS